MFLHLELSLSVFAFGVSLSVFVFGAVGTCAKIALKRDFNGSGLKIGQQATAVLQRISKQIKQVENQLEQ